MCVTDGYTGRLYIALFIAPGWHVRRTLAAVVDSWPTRGLQLFLICINKSLSRLKADSAAHSGPDMHLCMLYQGFVAPMPSPAMTLQGRSQDLPSCMHALKEPGTWHLAVWHQPSMHDTTHVHVFGDMHQETCSLKAAAHLAWFATMQC